MARPSGERQKSLSPKVCAGTVQRGVCSSGFQEARLPRERPIRSVSPLGAQASPLTVIASVFSAFNSLTPKGSEAGTGMGFIVWNCGVLL